jgi:hypothetical protein
MNNCHNGTRSDGRAAALFVVAIARYDCSSRLASHRAEAAQLFHLFIHGS